METEKNRLEELYVKWFNNTITQQEKAELVRLLDAGASKEQLSPVIEKIWEQLEEDDDFSLREKHQLADNILKQWPSEPVVSSGSRVRSFRWITAAAAVLVLAGGLFIWKRSIDHQLIQQPDHPTASKGTEVIAPGRDGAVLTLSDGRQVVLDSTANGIIGNQGGAEIALHNNQVIYKAGAAHTGQEIAYNSMSTARGRQFQLVLPDGSRVWLNAASRIKYPVTFTGKERRVEITGEAFFEVAVNKAQPFIVQTKGQEVLALGTSFNVNAYDNDDTEETTLVDGSVKVNAMKAADRKRSSTILKPGQQASLNNTKQSISVSENQTEAAIAWRNGFFHLENIPFDKVMKQLERWYDIEVVYENGVPDLHFLGGISRNMRLDALIRALKVSEVRFKMETGRRLIVYK